MNHQNKKQRRKNYNFKWLWNASVIPEVIPMVVFFAFFSFVVVLIYQSGVNLNFSALSLAVPAVVLGLLLVFRTNTAYDRFWEARKLWGCQIAVSRHLAQSICSWISIEKEGFEEENLKIMQLIPAFAIATKFYLRSESFNSELIDLINSEQYEYLNQQAHPPLTILGWMRNWVQQQFQQNLIDSLQMDYLFQTVDTMGFNLGGCERILKTPMPLAYSLHLRHLIYIYCLLFPFQVVDSLYWLTIPITCLVAFALFGIEEIGVEIQDPFGYDENDLPLDRYCQIIRNEVEEIVTTALTNC